MARPVVLFDGECGFCRRWIERWRAAAGGRVDFEPSQAAAGRFPEIDPGEFERSIQLVLPNGAVFSGAAAVLRARSAATGHSWLLAAYERIPGLAPAAEAAYRLVARHRPLLSRLTQLFWGADVRRPTFGTSTRLFLRLLGTIHLVAFLSFWTQLDGLVGPRGILPAQQFFDALRGPLGPSRFWQLPTLCWLFGAGWFLHALCGAGVVLALALVAGFAPRLCLVLLWSGYLSLCAAGQVFMNYQWDALLLETTFLAIFLAPRAINTWGLRVDPPRPARWLLWWLLIRLMLLSGAAKLLSGDETWRSLTALYYHFETQPLPTWIGWYAHHAPAWCLRLACAGMFAIELAGPLLLLFPRRLRHLGAWLQICLQVSIALTGNYTFFNLLTGSLCLLFFDDLFWRNARRRLRLPARTDGPGCAPAPSGWLYRGALTLAAAASLSLTVPPLLSTLLPRWRLPAAVFALQAAAGPFRSANQYGLFAVMTRERPEIIIEGSNDHQTWLPYGFKAKPGDLRRRPGFIAPFQPRLDWQLWFAALDYPNRDPWVTNLCVRLLQGSPPVLALFGRNPFPHGPPREIRAVLYNYRFTDWATHAATGRWWDRTRIGIYLGPGSLR